MLDPLDVQRCLPDQLTPPDREPLDRAQDVIRITLLRLPPPTGVDRGLGHPLFDVSAGRTCRGHAREKDR